MQYVTEWTLPDGEGGMFTNQCTHTTRAQVDRIAFYAVSKCRSVYKIRGGIHAVYDRYVMDDNGKVVTE